MSKHGELRKLKAAGGRRSALDWTCIWRKQKFQGHQEKGPVNLFFTDPILTVPICSKSIEQSPIVPLETCPASPLKTASPSNPPWFTASNGLPALHSQKSNQCVQNRQMAAMLPQTEVPERGVMRAGIFSLGAWTNMIS